MSPQEILAKAVQRARYAAHTPRAIPIREIRQVVDIPVTRLKPEPPKIVPKIPEVPPQFNRPAMKTVVSAVASYYAVPEAQIYSECREKFPTRVRHIALYLASRLCGRSFAEIGRYANRDHTTVLHGVRKIERLLASDELLRAQIDKIKELINLGAGGPPTDPSAPAANPPAVGATIHGAG